MARIPYVDPANPPAELREQFARMAEQGRDKLHVYRAMAISPPAFRAVFGLAEALWLESDLDRALQELIILRTAILCGSDYEWGRHRHAARRFGLADAKVAALPAWESSDVYDARERAALRVCDEATRTVEASAEAIAALRPHYSDRQAAEIVLLTGFYGMVARFLRSMQVDQEPGDERVPALG
jgi:4-carboxymuconolactone decarboxylase